MRNVYIYIQDESLIYFTILQSRLPTCLNKHCTMYSRPVRTNFFFAILKTFTSVTIMYAMMNKCLKF